MNIVSKVMMAIVPALGIRGRDICDAVENAPLIYHIDIVRPEEMANARLKEKIARDGVVIYPA